MYSQQNGNELVSFSPTNNILVDDWIPEPEDIIISVLYQRLNVVIAYSLVSTQLNKRLNIHI